MIRNVATGTSSAGEGRRPQRLALTLLAVLLSACVASVGQGSASPPGSPATTAGATAAASADPAPTPSTLTPGPTVPTPTGRPGLVIRQYSCDTCALPIGTVVLDDGRVIWDSSAGVSVRWLTAAGLAAVRAQVDNMPLLAKSASFEPSLVPGASPPAFGPTAHTFLVDRGGSRVRVLSADAPEFAGFSGAYRIPDAMIVLSALAAQMKDPETWLPSESWAGPATPFTPDRYLVSIGRWAAGTGDDSTIDIDTVAWPFGPIASAGTPGFSIGSAGDSNARCLVITADQARAMAAAERAAGARRDPGFRISEQTYRSARENGARFSVLVTWLLPYQASCADFAADQ